MDKKEREDLIYKAGLRRKELFKKAEQGKLNLKEIEQHENEGIVKDYDEKNKKHKCLANMEEHFIKDCPSLKGFKKLELENKKLPRLEFKFHKKGVYQREKARAFIKKEMEKRGIKKK